MPGADATSDGCAALAGRRGRLRRRLLAFAAGAAGVLALPPFDLWPFLFVAFSGLVLALFGALAGASGPVARARAGAGVGWWFGFGYFLAGLWWIGSAFLVEAERFAALMPFAVAGLPAGLALFPAAGCALAALVLRTGPSAPLALAAGLTLSELARQTILTGFPWNAYGLAWTASLPLAQTASLVGQTGLNFLAVAIGAVPALFVARERSAGLAGPVLVATLAAAVVAAMAVFGVWRLESVPATAGGGPPVRIVQPAVPQEEKWLPGRADAIFDGLLDLTIAERPPEPGTLVVWPETAFPFLYEGNAAAERAVGAALPAGTELLVGAVRRVDDPTGAPAFFNGVLLVDAEGAVVDVYDKVRLVPFGEFLPFRALLGRIGLERLAAGAQDFTAGSGHHLLETAAGRRLLGLVCYEAIFPEIPRGLAERPDFLANLTNDAWFGDTPGPHQHFRQARLRAIETGLPLVRAANTGISAIVDPAGRVRAHLSLGVRGTIDGRLPPPLAPSLYATLGDLPVLVLSLALLALLAVRRR